VRPLQKKHIIVTGGSRGLGAAIIEGLLASGYRVSTCSRSKSSFIEKIEQDERHRSDFFWQASTVGDEDQADSFVRACIEWAGDSCLYGLINNAGIAMAGILATFPNVETEKILRVNLLGSIQMARLVSQYLVRFNKGGRIINISSIIGSRGYNGLSVYSASKAGLDGFSRALAREVGRRQITVNSIAPGYIRTDMSSTLNAGQLAQIVNRTPLGRLGIESDVVGLVNFLLSDNAAFITGQTIHVDGGISC
jgi:3-oxoacyl-[acyl-carrier protein] reductase